MPPPAKDTNTSPVASNTAGLRRESIDEAVNVPLWLDQSVVAQSTKQRNADSMDIGMGYQMYVYLILWNCSNS